LIADQEKISSEEPLRGAVVLEVARQGAGSLCEIPGTHRHPPPKKSRCRSPARRKPARRPLPEHLPRERIGEITNTAGTATAAG
jgi:hypothetical protein